ncbi:MAG: hypothetical protein QM692_06755 [Thermomicrobiales bacterium]
MKMLLDFGRFWYDFIVGDDALIAIGVVLAMAVTAVLTANHINAWWLLAGGVFASLAWSVLRAPR